MFLRVALISSRWCSSSQSLKKLFGTSSISVLSVMLIPLVGLNHVSKVWGFTFSLIRSLVLSQTSIAFLRFSMKNR